MWNHKELILSLRKNHERFGFVVIEIIKEGREIKRPKTWSWRYRIVESLGWAAITYVLRAESTKSTAVTRCKIRHATHRLINTQGTGNGASAMARPTRFQGLKAVSSECDRRSEGYSRLAIIIILLPAGARTTWSLAWLGFVRLPF